MSKPKSPPPPETKPEKAAADRPCACGSLPVYTGMAPLGNKWVTVAFRCGDCGSCWARPMLIVDANRFREEFDARVAAAAEAKAHHGSNGV